MLDEVHLPSNCALADDEVRGLKHFKAELGQHSRHKVGISIGEQRHVSHQAAAVKADDLLDKETEEIKRKRKADRLAGGQNFCGLCGCL